MNTYLKMQLDNMLTMVESFQKSCEMAAVQDDGVIDKNEQKQLNEVRKATEKYIAALKKIK